MLSTAFAQAGVSSSDGRVEVEALRLYGLPEAAPAILNGCPSLPAGTRTSALETSWDPPGLAAGATANVNVTMPGARQNDFADASLDTQQHRHCARLLCLVQQQRARHSAERQRVDD